MAKKSWRVKQLKRPKFTVRTYNRCQHCGRRRGYIGRFKLCRICFRELASQGMLPGVIKASW